MISLEKNFLFIHIPKTGGNSIQTVLKDYSEDRLVITREYHDGIERFEIRNDAYNIKKHSTLLDYKSVLDPGIFRKLFKFAAIRNPWDRMISFYFSPHRGLKEWDRHRFVDLLLKVKPVRHFIKTPPLLGSTLEVAQGPAEFRNPPLDSDIDFLIRYENLNGDFRLICEKLDIPYTPLPKKNQSNRDHYSRYYDEELIEEVQTKFVEEIEFGHYMFDRASQAAGGLER